jgi:hypothetical protein
MVCAFRIDFQLFFLANPTPILPIPREGAICSSTWQGEGWEGVIPSLTCLHHFLNKA